MTLIAFEYLSGRSVFPRLRQVWVVAGICSYSFYLYFDQLIYPVLGVLVSLAPGTSKDVLFSVGFPITFLTILAFSYIGYRAVELPSIALGRYCSAYMPFARGNKGLTQTQS